MPVTKQILDTVSRFILEDAFGIAPKKAEQVIHRHSIGGIDLDLQEKLDAAHYVVGRIASAFDLVPIKQPLRTPGSMWLPVDGS
jgi:hypothetical protein